MAHRVVILQTIELITGSKIEQISYPRIKSIISLASDEMTRSKVNYTEINILAEGQRQFNNVCFLPDVWARVGGDP